MAKSEPTEDFKGFPPALFEFLEGLEKDNSKSYWEVNKTTWTDVITPCIEALMATLEPQFGQLRTFRPQRDVRFSQDKSPYKTWIGITTTERATGGIGSFARLDKSGMKVAVGAMAFASDQVKSFRTALDDPSAAGQLDKICEKLTRDGLPVGPGAGGELARVPRGFDAAHEQSEKLRWKGLVILEETDWKKWFSTPKVAEHIASVWAAGQPLVEWIEKNVGESTAAPSRKPR